MRPQGLIKAVMSAYLASAKATVAKHREASARFHDTPVEVPSLVVYCERGDPIADTGPCEEVSQKWRAKVGGQACARCACVARCALLTRRRAATTDSAGHGCNNCMLR